jgi:hypothetical protein
MKRIESESELVVGEWYWAWHIHEWVSFKLLNYHNKVGKKLKEQIATSKGVHGPIPTPEIEE